MDLIEIVRADGVIEYRNPDYDRLVAASQDLAPAGGPQPTEAELEIYSQLVSNQRARDFLDATDWVAAKYTDEVVISERMTADEFRTKYADVLAARHEARESITDSDPIVEAL